MRFVCGLLLAALLPATAAGQSANSPVIVNGPAAPIAPKVIARDDAGHATIRAVRITTPITLDGRLDETIYRDTQSFGDFIQQEPFEGKPATERTDVWMLFDNDAVYVSARMWESAPGKRVTSDMQRDARNLFNNDHFAVLFDTFYDHRNGYYFYANSQGGMVDGQLVNEAPNNNWNGIWEVRAANFDGGWMIEFRIPFRSLRFRPGDGAWGVNFRRVVRWKNENSYLTAIPQSWGRRGLTKVSSAGSAVGLKTPSRPITMDLKPYVTGSSLTNRASDPPIANLREGAVGSDVKLGLGQSVVADVTYNTDFAQVEDDEAQVNLTRFSVFFPEKRDFFLEGQDYFNFAGASFNSGGGGFGPSNTPVLFYSRRIGISEGQPVPIRVGGRVLARGRGFQLGGLHIRTAEAPEVSAPATEYSVGRVNRDMFKRSHVGLIGTRRATIGDGAAARYAYGADVSFGLTASSELSGYWARTQTAGTAADRLTATAPDTSYRGRFELNSDGVGLELEHLYVGSAFDPAVGFLRRNAFRRSYAKGRLSPRPTNLGPVRKLFVEGSADYYANTAGEKETATFSESLRLELKNTDRISLEATNNFERLDATFDLGNGVTILPGSYTFTQYRFNYEMSPSRKVSGFLGASHGDFYDGTIDEVSWRGRVEFTSRFYAEPSVSRSWVRTPRGNGATDAFGSRLTFTLSPRMFVGALVQYRSTSSSLSSNVRFRWEYQPGSELFLVYSDGRNTLDRRFPPTLENRSIVVKITKLLRW